MGKETSINTSAGISAIDYMLALISGLLLTASFPKLNWNYFAWIAFVPLFCSIRNKRSGPSFKLGFLAGIAHYVTLLYWIAGVMKTYGHLSTPVSWSILLLLVIYLSLYLASFAALVSSIINRPNRSPMWVWLAPFLWVGLEYIRATVLSGFPWENLGYSQYNLLPLIQISDMFGVYGLSALIIAANLVLFNIWNDFSEKRTIPWKPIVFLGLLIVGSLSYGTWRIKQVEITTKIAPKQTVALIQGNIDQSKKWVESFQGQTVKRYKDLTGRALKNHPDIVVWPETALPFYFLDDQFMTKQVVEFIRTTKSHFVIGSPSFRKEKKRVHYYNSAYLLGPAGNVLGKYDKVHLVPYGEYIPFKRFFPFLGKIVESVGNFESGKKGQVLSMNSGQVGILICFEVIFPELARTMTQNGAQFLVNITNDAWFGTSSAPYQHLSMAVFRAIETRRAVARAANTGISAFISPTGRIFSQTPLFKKAICSHSLPLMNQRTFYVSYGYLFARLCAIMLFLYVGWCLYTGHFRNNKDVSLKS
ncbi:MAG: apolipoprotein N-acyltransferase [Deltaproteobacteria bacterium]|nr:apolipoprotein N-acyltransferase [Deltaproteobacteria bacterium]